jgi:hypothetical protein
MNLIGVESAPAAVGLSDTMLTTSSANAASDTIRRQKGCTLQELRELVAFNVLTDSTQKGDKSVGNVRKSKAKTRKNLSVIRNSFYGSALKKVEHKPDVSILSSASPASPAKHETDSQMNEKDMKLILESIHPVKPPSSQQQGLRSLEEISYDSSFHSSIHEPSVIQNLYFFIRAPPPQHGPIQPLQYELITYASSILANVCVTIPTLADDLLHLGMYKEIVKILHTFLPLPADPNDTLELAIEKVVGLLTNLQAKSKTKPLPYSSDLEDEEAAAACGDEILKLLLDLMKVQSFFANRAVVLCLKNVLAESRLMKRFIAQEEGVRLVCRIFSELCGYHSSLPPEIVVDWLNCMTLLLWHSDELLTPFVEFSTALSVFDLLVGPLAASPVVQVDTIRGLSFLSSNQTISDSLVQGTRVTEVICDVILTGQPVPVTAANPSIDFLRHRQSRLEEGDAASVVQKYSINTLANLSTGCESVVHHLIGDERMMVKLCTLLEEGDRTPSFVQVKVATILYNIMQTKDGRQCVAGIRKIKEVFRSQMSSTNKILRDIVAKLIAELRDETKKVAEDTENEQSVKKMRERRARVMDELMHTERTYVDHLLQMVAMFLRYKAISQEAKNKTDEENAIEMHANVEALSQVHFKFLQELEKFKKQEQDRDREDPPPPPPLPPPPSSSSSSSSSAPEEERSLGGILKEFLVGKLDVYRKYTQNFEKYQSITDEKAFRKFLEAERKNALKTSKKRVEMTPQSLLITPIQRIPRYVLLLEDLLDHMSVDNEDYNDLNEAFEGLMDMMEYLEDEKVRVEAMMKLTEIQNRMIKCDLTLACRGRVFLRDAPCLMDDSQHEELLKAHIFLFTDLLIITYPRGGKYKCKWILPLYVVMLADAQPVSFEEDGTEKLWHGFGIRSTVETDVGLNMYFESVDDSGSWSALITQSQVCTRHHSLYFQSPSCFPSFFPFPL